MGVAARTIQDGDTAVQLVQDGGTELVRLGADKLDLGTALTPEQDFIQDHDLNDDGHDAVQQLRHRAERDLDEDDGNVKDEHGGGHGPAEPFLQHQRRDVHAARGGPRPDDDAHKSPDTDGGKDRVQEKVLCEHMAMEHRLGKAQKDGAQDAAGQCVEGKGPAQYHPAPDQHG